MIEVGQIRIWTSIAEGTTIGKKIKIKLIDSTTIRGQILIGYSYPIARKDGHIFKRDKSFILRHSSPSTPVLEAFYES
jgi:hypothetical protein